LISQQAIYWQGSIPFCSTLEGNLGTIVKLAILKSREIATVAALTALGNTQPQLKVRIHGTLNISYTREEVVEALVQRTIYTGFAAALNGLFAAK
jgi:4-carboxymuconolactone decarboxylase